MISKIAILDQDHQEKIKIIEYDLDHWKDRQNKKDLWSSDQRSMIFPISAPIYEMQVVNQDLQPPEDILSLACWTPLW